MAYEQAVNEVYNPYFDETRGEESGGGYGTGGGSGSSSRTYYCNLGITFKLPSTFEQSSSTTINYSVSFKNNTKSTLQTKTSKTTFSGTTKTVYVAFSASTNGSLGVGVADITAWIGNDGEKKTYSVGVSYTTSPNHSVSTTIGLYGNSIILPSIYKPFYFKANVIIDKDGGLYLVMSVVNGTTYEYTEGKLGFDSAILKINNQKYYIKTTSTTEGGGSEWAQNGIEIKNKTINWYAEGIKLIPEEQLGEQSKHLEFDAVLKKDFPQIECDMDELNTNFVNDSPHRVVNFYTRIPFRSMKSDTESLKISLAITEGHPDNYAGDLDIKTIEYNLPSVAFPKTVFDDKTTKVNENLWFVPVLKSNNTDRDIYMTTELTDLTNLNLSICRYLTPNGDIYSLDKYLMTEKTATPFAIWCGANDFMFASYAQKIKLNNTKWSTPFAMSRRIVAMKNDDDTVESKIELRHVFSDADAFKDDLLQQFFFAGTIEKKSNEMLVGIFDNHTNLDEEDACVEFLKQGEKVPRHTNELAIIKMYNG